MVQRGEKRLFSTLIEKVFGIVFGTVVDNNEFASLSTAEIKEFGQEERQGLFFIVRRNYYGKIIHADVVKGKSELKLNIRYEYKGVRGSVKTKTGKRNSRLVLREPDGLL